MFTILAERRSGTHLLASLLDSHPNLRCYDEIMLPYCTKLKLGCKEIEMLNENEGCIISYRSFCKLPSKTKKMIMKNKVIHLIRNNLRNHAISIEKMAKTYNSANLAWRKKEIIRNRNKVFSFNHKFKFLFEISYEDICSNKSIKEYRNTKLLKFLGVKPAKLTTDLIKGINPQN